MNPIEQNAAKLLNLMFEGGLEQYSKEWFEANAEMVPQDVNDAMDYLSSLGAVRLIKTFGTAPFAFSTALFQSRGRYIYHQIKEREGQEEVRLTRDNNGRLPPRPVNPVGSPYGFTDQDWEEVALRKEDDQALFAVLGMQFESSTYDTKTLMANMKRHVEIAVERYNTRHPKRLVNLEFEPLGAGLGEHLFNEIARSIIGADIAFFETSDLNANVMLEMGVALTWGVRVIPIKERSQSKPPSDISGQTWVDYEDSGNAICDSRFYDRLVKTIERIVAMKGS